MRLSPRLVLSEHVPRLHAERSAPSSVDLYHRVLVSQTIQPTHSQNIYRSTVMNLPNATEHRLPSNQAHYCICRAHCGGGKPVTLKTWQRHQKNRDRDLAEPGWWKVMYPAPGTDRADTTASDGNLERDPATGRAARESMHQNFDDEATNSPVVVCI